MNTKHRNGFFVSILLGIALTFVGCSGSSSSSDNSNTGGTPPPTSKIAVGAMTKGSVIVNGVRFDDTAPNITITSEDTAKNAAFLADGMNVKVKGTVSADGLTGTAEAVEVVSEARGAITSKGTDTVEIHKQTVLIDAGTVLAGGVASIASLTANDNIEVHGGRDDTGVIHATRVEKLAAGAVFVDEVRGAVGGKTTTTFNIGGLTITFNASTVIVPAGAPFIDGDVVEVHLNGSTATRIAVEHHDHPEFEPAEGQELSFEGILADFSPTSTFKVGTQQVKLDAAARIEGGVLADLVAGMKVEAEGHAVTGGILNAEKITIKDSIRIEANAESTGSVKVLGKDVKTTSMTKLSSDLSSIASITTGDGLRVRGFVNKDGVITATRVDKQNSVAPSKIIIQGPVKDISATTHTLTIMGITISAGSAIARPNDDKGTDTLTMPLDSFFSSLTADRTIVKVKGSFTSGTPGSLAASEVEIE